MKQVLSLLTAFVFLQMQTWALSGGPVFPNQSSPNVAGVYSGVMVQVQARFGDEFDGPNSGTTSNQDNPAGSIGAYSVTVPATGLSTGQFVAFVNGTLYTGGTITGVADPDKGTFDGVMSATISFLDQNGATFQVPLRGQMRTKIIEKKNTPQSGRTDLTAGNAARMEGKAEVDAFETTNSNLTPIPNVRVKYSVSGYRQSTTALP